MTRKNFKTISVITGSRAEYGLLKKLIKLISNERNLDLKLIVTGSHMEDRFGFTVNEIVKDKFKIDKKIKIHIKKKEHINFTISRGIKLISKSLAEIKPDFLVVLGDRYEILSAAISSFFLNIPIIHIHGGEKTLGSFDDIIRHSITKMSYIHFVAAEEYKKRVIQLGEEPKRIFNVGGLGVDIIKSTNLLSRRQLTKILPIDFNKKNILVTLHPETSGDSSPKKLSMNTLQELEKLNDTNLFFTESNADPGGQEITKNINNFVKKDKRNRFIFKSLGISNYLSLASNVDLVVGNSSSGLLEIPYLNVPTLNIGRRQEGRLRSSSVYDCDVISEKIGLNLRKMLQDDFLNNVNFKEKPYGDGGASKKIIKVIKELNKPDSIEKNFFDL